MPVTRRAQHAEDTRRSLLDASRHEFAAKGFAGASLDDIASRARVTKGALYHHFPSKAALLEAVYVELEEEIATKVRNATTSAGGAAMARVAAALDAFFRASADPVYLRIVPHEAPFVLGRIKGRRLDHAIGLDVVVDLITALKGEGLLGDVPIEMSARIFLAAVSEVAMSAAHSDAPDRVRAEGMMVLATMIEGVRLATAASARRT
jgi:AcrR family transcriptional regulator